MQDGQSARQTGKTQARMKLLVDRCYDLMKDSGRRDDHIIVYVTYNTRMAQETIKTAQDQIKKAWWPYTPRVIGTDIKNLEKRIKGEKIFDIIIDPAVFARCK